MRSLSCNIPQALVLTAVLRVEEVGRSFGAHQVLSRVSFTLKQQSINALIGPGGCGKSLLFKIIGGIDKGFSGAVSSDELLLDSVSLMFQEGALFDSLSVMDNVAFPLVAGNVPTNRLPRNQRDMVSEAVFAILRRVGLTRAANKMPAQLSGGMRKRVSLARALVSKPKLLLLDDPIAGLDPVASSVIMEFIKELHDEYKPITIIISHDLRRLFPICEHVLGLFNGIIKFDGTLDALKAFQDRQVREFVSCRFEL